jgi:iron complex transport system permease protein
MTKQKKLFILGILFLGSILLCVGVGAVMISPREFFQLLLGEGKKSHETILFHIRLPRVAACILAGSGLAVSGVVIQNVLQNPLAGPNIIGVNAGAGFFVVLWSFLFPYSYRGVPFAAFFGALLTVLFIYALAKKTGASRVTLVLAGVCVNSVLNAASDVIHTLGDDTLTGTYSFRLGGFTAVSIRVLYPAGALILIGILLVWLLHNELEIFSLGEEVAASLGLRIGFIRFVFLVLAAVLAGAAVSIAGLLGFVGLVAPHISRRLVGEECGFLVPFAALFGSTFVMLCDLVARTALAPYELPTGILLSFVGAQFFIYLLFRQKRRKID